jgi:hypothetical protein
MTKEMLNTRAIRTDRGPTGRHNRLRGFGDQKPENPSGYGFPGLKQ